MDKQYGEFVGVDSLHFAKILQDDATGYMAETPRFLAPSAEIAAETETNNTPTYYDNKPGNNYVSEGITTITMTVSNVPGKLAAELLGKSYDAATGRVLDSGIPIPPECAVGYRAGIGTSDHRYTWYLKGTFSGGTEEAATKSNDVDIRNYELTFTAIVTTKEWLVDGELQGLKKISGDTTDSAFNPTGWFNQVQTPDTSSAPAALTLSSIVPSTGVTTVAVDSAISLTFSNPIATESITIIDSTDASIVGVKKSFNAAKTVLTLTPVAAMEATTNYIISIAGVKDAYGQSLATTSSNFTTV